MALLTDLSDWELSDPPKVGKNGQVLCRECNLNPAIVTEYGMMRKCQRCQDKFEPPRIGLIVKERFGNELVSTHHLRHMNTRVVDDNGKTISGEAGLKYMRARSDKYAARLKAYEKIND